MLRRLRFFRRLYDWTRGWADRPSATWALLALSTIDNVFFPVPSEVLQYALYGTHPRRSFWFATVVVVGTLLGASLGYGIGSLLDELAQWLLGGGEEELASMSSWLREHTFWAVLVGSLTPFSDKLVVIGSGILRLPFWTFLPAYTLGRAVRTYPAALLFRTVGPKVQPWIERYVEPIGAVATVVLLALLVAFAVVSL